MIFISWLTNILYGSNLTDVYTCYKIFKASFFKNLKIESNGFEFEEEITIKALKQKLKIIEIPISYFPRSFKEGKKIGWRDGIKAVWVMFKYKIKPNDER